MKIVLCKVANTKGEIKEFVGGFRRDTLGSSAGIRHSVYQPVIVSGSLKETSDHEAKALQQGVHGAVCDAAGGVRKSFVDAPAVVKRSLSLIVGHSNPDNSARLCLHILQAVRNDRVGQRLFLIAEVHLWAIYLENQRMLLLVGRILVIISINFS